MPLTMTVNGAMVAIDGRAHENLLDALRRKGLTGCKEGCAEGECGACAVLVRRRSVVPAVGDEWASVNACLVPAADMSGQEVVTSEGLSATDVHPVARALAEAGGSQCGFCTPGFVCAAAAEYYRPSRGEAGDFDVHALSGNLCRCTGYRPIQDAVQSLRAPAPGDPLAEGHPVAPAAAFHVKHDDAVVERPTDVAVVLDALANAADGDRPTLVAGATDHGVQVNLVHRRPTHVLHLGGVDALRQVTIGDDAVRIGAAASLHDVERTLGDRVPLLAQLWPQFASRLIRSRATLGGNLGAGSPIGDAAPALLALDAELDLLSRGARRRVALQDYFTGYRTSVRRPDELIAEVIVPLRRPSSSGQRVERFIKVAKRRFDDISSVAIAVVVDVEDGLVTRARIGAGGLAATPLRAHAVEEALVDRAWTPTDVASAAAGMRELGTPLDDHRASADYRRAMAEQALLKACAETTGVMA